MIEPLLPVTRPRETYAGRTIRLANEVCQGVALVRAGGPLVARDAGTGRALAARYTNGTGEPSAAAARAFSMRRSEEHTSELQSLRHLVCRLLLEKKKKKADCMHKNEK